MRNAQRHGHFQAKAEPTDPFSAEAPTWSKFSDAYFGVRPLSGQEILDAKQVQSQVTHQLKTPYIDGVNTKMRIRIGAVQSPDEDTESDWRVFEIEALVDFLEQRRELHLMCKEVV